MFKVIFFTPVLFQLTFWSLRLLALAGLAPVPKFHAITVAGFAVLTGVVPS
jgi:hypothetical protein